MAYFLQQLINGLTLGSIYGLIAIGYTMVYGIIGMINFAHGEIYMIGAFISIIAFLVLGMAGVTYVPLALAIVLLTTMFFTSIYGWAVERIAYRPLRGSHRLAPLISAIGMSIFLQNYVQILQGRVKPMQPVVQDGFTIFESGGFAVRLSYLQLFIMVLTLALMIGFTTLIAATPLGRSQRACEQDMRMASLLGVDVDRVISMTFVMGAALAAVAGLMVTLYYGVVDFFIGFLAGVKAFTAAVLGGIGSLPGAMLGGLMIGLIEAFWSGYFSVEYKDVSVFVVLVLVSRPSTSLPRSAAPVPDAWMPGSSPGMTSWLASCTIGRSLSTRGAETALLEFAECDRARFARDPAYDGRFFTGVRTTGVYCRPVCPVRPARSANVGYYPSAAAAEAAGFRPCLRCRPETAPFCPAWKGSRTTVERALRLIEEGVLDAEGSTVDGLAERVGIGARQLARLFARHLHASPSQVAKTVRVQRAKRLLDTTDLPVAAIALQAGFTSLRRFNTVFAEIYGRPPTEIRRRGPNTKLSKPYISAKVA